MSARNALAAKRARRDERDARKAKAARSIPFGGVVVTQKDVIGQRYLAVHGMPFSPSVASVKIVPAKGEGK